MIFFFFPGRDVLLLPAPSSSPQSLMRIHVCLLQSHTCRFTSTSFQRLRPHFHFKTSNILRTLTSHQLGPSNGSGSALVSLFWALAFKLAQCCFSGGEIICNYGKQRVQEGLYLCAFGSLSRYIYTLP